MRKYDVVYILKDGTPGDELRYSLRSVERNLEHRHVWFVCGKPSGLIPDKYMDHTQSGSTKWERVRSSLISVCKNDNITKQFWLFNDDFYILQPIEKQFVYHRGLLADHIKDVETRHAGTITGYTRQLRNCEQMLRDAGLTTLDYAIHIPMLIDREKMLETLEMFPRCPMFRSLYGNYAGVGGEYMKDNKTTDANKDIDKSAPFLSTSNISFGGRVREQIEEMFPDVCKYEAEYDGESIR